MKTVHFGPLAVGEVPRVVGTLSRLDSLRDFPSRTEKPCDIAEIRLDLIGIDGEWLRLCQSLKARNFPSILTLRSTIEGGKWNGSDEQRLALTAAGLPHVSSVDVEISSPAFDRLCSLASEHKKPVIASFHDFQETPPWEELMEVIGRASRKAGVVKISTLVNHADDIQVLERLLATRSDAPLCVIGMGPMGTPTRTSFCTIGSCLTYGYIDSPSAPGQLSAQTVVNQLRQILPRYNQDFITRNQELQSA